MIELSTLSVESDEADTVEDVLFCAQEVNKRIAETTANRNLFFIISTSLSLYIRNSLHYMDFYFANLHSGKMLQGSDPLWIEYCLLQYL